MTRIQQAAQFALSQRLTTLLPPEVREQFVGDTHAQRLADNLLPGFSAEQIRVLRAQLARGAGGELTPTRTGKRPAHAPYSSAALALNAFGTWLGHAGDLTVAGLNGFDFEISLEHKLQIAHDGGEANLDCVLTTANSLVGIESKLTEYLAPHAPVQWRDPYKQPEMETLLTDGWQDVFQASLTRQWNPEHLGLEQLIKHALALNSHAHNRTTHLVYVFWEPANGDDIREVTTHRAEIAELKARVEGAQPTLHALSYESLFAEWAEIKPAAPELNRFLEQLHSRYTDITIREQRQDVA